MSQMAHDCLRFRSFVVCGLSLMISDHAHLHRRKPHNERLPNRYTAL